MGWVRREALSVVLMVVMVAVGLWWWKGHERGGPPHHIDHFAIYTEGDEYMALWFTFKDAQGVATRAVGRADLTLRHDGEITCASDWLVSEADFREVTVGRGAFERKMLATAVGNVSQEPCRPQPGRYGGQLESLDAELVFTTRDGTRMTASDRVYVRSLQ